MTEKSSKLVNSLLGETEEGQMPEDYKRPTMVVVKLEDLSCSDELMDAISDLEDDDPYLISVRYLALGTIAEMQDEALKLIKEQLTPQGITHIYTG